MIIISLDHHYQQTQEATVAATGDTFTMNTFMIIPTNITFVTILPRIGKVHEIWHDCVKRQKKDWDLLPLRRMITLMWKVILKIRVEKGRMRIIIE